MGVIKSDHIQAASCCTWLSRWCHERGEESRESSFEELLLPVPSSCMLVNVLLKTDAGLSLMLAVLTVLF